MEAFAGRTLDDPALKIFLASHGRSPAIWPMEAWTQDDLALVAQYFNADYRIAEAEWEVAQRQRERDLQTANPQLGLKAERSNDPTIRSPWTVGLELGFTLTNATRRSARETLADLRVQQAALKISDTAWRLRAQVRDALRELAYSRGQLALSVHEQALIDEEVKIIEKRVELGAASRADLLVKTSLAQQAALAAAETQAQAALAAATLAAAIGVPSSAIETFRVLDGKDNAQVEIDFANYQRNALQNRHDMRRALLDYAEAEANITLETTRDRDINLAPGIKWDQGANVWSLAAAFVLPLLHDNSAAVAVAVAQRQAAARRVEATQQRALADIRAAWTDWQAQRAVVTAARTAQTSAQRGVELAEKNFAGGMIDRLDLRQAESAHGRAQQQFKRTENGLARAAARLEDAGQYLPIDLLGSGDATRGERFAESAAATP